MIMIIYLMRIRDEFFSLVRFYCCYSRWWHANVICNKKMNKECIGEISSTIFLILGGVQFMSNYIANCNWLHWSLGSFDAQPNRMANSKFTYKISNVIFGCQMPPTPYMLAIDSGRLQFYYNEKNSVIACVCRLCHLWKSHGKSEFCSILHFHYYYYYLVTL